MESNPEQRDDTRFYHEATIMIEHYPKGKYYEGRMFNYSRGGMYYESDFAPEPGTDVFIGIEESPYSSGHDVYRARVMWVKKLPDRASFFYYGIGVKYH
jgi:hypothetical protein